MRNTFAQPYWADNEKRNEKKILVGIYMIFSVLFTWDQYTTGIFVYVPLFWRLNCNQQRLHYHRNGIVVYAKTGNKRDVYFLVQKFKFWILSVYLSGSSGIPGAIAKQYSAKHTEETHTECTTLGEHKVNICGY